MNIIHKWYLIRRGKFSFINTDRDPDKQFLITTLDKKYHQQIEDAYRFNQRKQIDRLFSKATSVTKENSLSTAHK